MTSRALNLALLSTLLLGCQGPDDDTGDSAEPIDTSDSGDTGTADPYLLDDDFETALTFDMGCGDFYIFARDEGDTIGLVVEGLGLAEAAHAAGEAVELSYNLPDDSLSLVALSGEHVTHYSCNDALRFEPVIVHQYDAVSGTATISATPTGKPTSYGGFPADAVLELEGVELSAGDDLPTVTIESLVIEAGIGWLPG